MSGREPATLAEGTRLRERYRILRVLGSGGTAVAYLAEDERTRDRCVVKELRIDRAAEWKVVELFEREARVLARLQHAHIPRFIDWFTEDEGSRLYLVESFVPGVTLAALIRDGRRLCEPDAIHLARELAEVLRYIHGAEPQVIHRDLKPSNVLVSDPGPGGRPLLAALIDFGAAREELALGRRGQRGETVAGSFGYMPFEQFEGQASPRSDLYALGATLVHLLSHREPATLLSPEGRIELRPHVNVSPGLVSVLERLVEPRPEDRYPSAAALIEDLRALRAGRRPRQTERIALAQPSYARRSQTAGGFGNPPRVPITTSWRARWRDLRQALRRRPRLALAGAVLLTAMAALGWRLLDPGVTTVGLGKQVSHLAFAGEDRLIAASEDGRFGAWRVGRHAPEWTLRPRNTTSAVAASPDGETVARGTTSFDRDRNVHRSARLELYRAEDGVRLQTLPWHRQRLEDLAFSPDGRVLAVVANDQDRRERFAKHGEIRLLRLRAGGAVDLDVRALVIERGGGQPFLSLAFRPDGQAIAYLSRRFAPAHTHLAGTELVLRALDSGRETVCPVPAELAATHVRFSPDGQLLAISDTASESALLLGDDCRAAASLGPPPRDYSFRAFVPAVFAAGGLVYPQSRTSLLPWGKLPWLRPGADAIREIVVYDTGRQVVRRRWPLRMGIHGYPVQALAASPGGRWLAAGYGDIYDGAFKVWRAD